MFSSQNSQVSNDANYIEDVFSTTLYTGNGSTQTITNNIDLSTKGGLVWFKKRNAAVGHQLIDTARGDDNVIGTESTSAQSNIANLTTFSSSGFSLDSGSTRTNNSGDTYTSWTFREQPKFFDIVTWTGNDTAGRTISHNLGSIPGCIIVKETSGVREWYVYHRSTGNTKSLFLNTTDASVTDGSWNNTTPTATQFTLGAGGSVNGGGKTYVAYLFAHDAGGFGLTGTDNVISCGSFTTDGSGNATVSLGYEPQWVLFKNSAATGSWRIYDSMRGIATGGVDAVLYPNLSAAEDTGSDSIDLTSTGFLVKGLSASNAHIYIAIRKGPMKVPTDATKVFAPAIGVSSSSAPYMTDLTSFTVDAQLMGSRTNVENKYESSRLQGTGKILYTNTTGAEVSADYPAWDRQTGVGSNVGNSNFSAYITYNFRRAPNFFDEVCYTGTGSNLTLNHNLGVTPELIIIKKRSAAASWPVFSSITSSGYSRAFLDLTSDATSYVYANGAGLASQPTSTQFAINGGSSFVGTSGATFVTYLFATCAGVSKVGSYTGTGTTKQIDCGFTSGARFVLIKRTDSTGDWYVWDSARGIVSGNDPYLLLNSTAAEVTSTDYIDTYSAGFEISSTAPAAINASGGTFIFLAIA